MAALDYEIKSTYSVEVTATDPDGLSDTIDVTINVTDVDDEPQWTRWSRWTRWTRMTPTETAGIQIDELFDAIDDYFDDER